MRCSLSTVSALAAAVTLAGACVAPSMDEALGYGSEGQELTVVADIEGHWAQAFVEELVARGVVAGYPDGTFRPENTLTRAEFAALISKAFAPAPIRNGIAFTDVGSGHWARGHIDTVVRGGFMSGYPDGKFQPNQLVNRTEVWVALASGLGLTETYPNTLDYFLDVQAIAPWAKSRLVSAGVAGLLASHPVPYQLRPTAPATRADSAVAIYQALVFLGQATAIDSPALASGHFQDSACYYRTDALGFSTNSRHVIHAETFIDGGAGLPHAEMTIANVEGNTCVAGGCRVTRFSENDGVQTRSEALGSLLTATQALRASLGLTAPRAGTFLAEVERTAASANEELVLFRSDERNATIAVRLTQQSSVDATSGIPSASHTLVINDGHFEYSLDSLANVRQWTFGYRIKGAVLAPDRRGLTILVESIQMGFECSDIHTMVQTLRFED